MFGRFLGLLVDLAVASAGLNCLQIFVGEGQDVNKKTTLAEIQLQCKPSTRSFFLLLVFVGIGEEIGRSQSGMWFRFAGSLLGFIVAVLVEIRVIASSLGITASMMMICQNFKRGGAAEQLCNNVLRCYITMKARSGVPRSLLGQICVALLKGLHALAEYPESPGFVELEQRCGRLVRYLEQADASTGVIGNMNEHLLGVLKDARVFSQDSIREAIGLLQSR